MKRKKKTIANNCLGLLRKLRCFIPRKPLISIDKAFLKPHLDYCDVMR